MAGHRYYTTGRGKNRCKTWSAPACLFLKLAFPQIPEAVNLRILGKTDPRAHWEKFVCQVNLRRIQEREKACIGNSWTLNFYPQENQLLFYSSRLLVKWVPAVCVERQMGDKTKIPSLTSTSAFRMGATILQKDSKIVYWVQCAYVYYKFFYYGYCILPLNILLMHSEN